MELSDFWIKEISCRLLYKNEKIAVAESVTSGFLQLMFSQMERASQFYCGGMTVYTLEQKMNLLHIDFEEALENNCVSPQITETMGKNVMSLFDSDWAIAVTGYASPVPESDFELFAYYSIHYKNEILMSDKIQILSEADPLNIQYFYTDCILDKFNEALKETEKTSADYVL